MADKPMTAERLQQIRDRFDSGMYNELAEDDVLSLLNERDRLVEACRALQPSYADMHERVESAYIAHLKDFDDPYDDCSIQQDINEHDAAVINKVRERIKKLEQVVPSELSGDEQWKRNGKYVCLDDVLAALTNRI